MPDDESDLHPVPRVRCQIHFKHVLHSYAPKKATSKGAAAGDFSATHHPPSLTMKNSRASELMCVQTMARQSLSTEFHSQGRTLFRS